ncbi:hypothetical protein ACTJKN_02585 [Pedobacter sp. 22163]|uniref:hypothetical protein n=1 Tax=Pedobacter sp. 22163 TaxID=3453883 RepID=UPI003F844247
MKENQTGSSKWVWPIISLALAIALAVTLTIHFKKDNSFTGTNNKKLNISELIPIGSYRIAQCLENSGKKIEIYIYDQSPVPKLIKFYELPPENAAAAIAILKSGAVSFKSDNKYIIQDGEIKKNVH